MGWYDAFKGNTARVNMSQVTSNAGSGAKNFGDAFAKIGDTMLAREDRIKADELAGEKSKLLESQINMSNANLSKMNSEAETKAENWVQNSDNQDYIAQAYKSNSLDELKVNYPLNNTNAIDAKTQQDVINIFDAKDKKAQINFNDEAVKQSVEGGYKDFNAFKDANPDVVKMADGVTMTKIDKYFENKDTSLAKLTAKEKDIKHATAISKLQAKVVKASADKSKKAFKYTEVTDSKIASQVKTAMGMDAPDFSFDDKSKKEYEDTVAGSAGISKKYNLEPSLAIHVFQNPELYDFSVDGKILMKKTVKKPVEKKTSSWKDYQ